MNPALWIWAVFWPFQVALGAKILVYLPSLSRSHHFVYRSVLKALADKGHHITYITGIDWKDRPDNVEQRCFNLSLLEIIKHVGPGEADRDKSLSEMVRTFSAISMAKMYNKMFQYLLDISFGHSITQDLIHSGETYDLLMSEATRGMEGIAAFQHRFNALGVILHTRGDNSWANEMIGLPDNPAYMVDAKMGYSDQMDFFERMNNLYFNIVSNWLSYQNLLEHQVLVDKHLRYDGWESRPPLTQLIADQALVLSNSHISTGYPYPKASNFKEVGGTNVPEPKPLTDELQKHLINKDNGLIYFSMGSNIDFNNPMMRADHIRKLFLSVFARREETVFWKLSGQLKEQASDNVHVAPWFPQIDVLAHNQTKCFISHGGALSVMESVSQGVPIIGIPIFGDQKKNILQTVNAGYGIMLDVFNLTETSINWALNEVIGNPRYKQKAMERSKMFHDRPMKPIDEAVYWIEYVLRNGKALQPASARLRFYQLYLLDVIGLVLLVTAVTLYILKMTVTKCLKVARNRKLNKEKTQ